MERKSYSRKEGLGLRELLAMNFSSGGRDPSAGSPAGAVSPPRHPTEQSRTNRSAVRSSNSALRDACFCSVRQPTLKINVSVSAAPVGPMSNPSSDPNGCKREFSPRDELVCNMKLQLSIDFLLPARAVNRDPSHGSGTAPRDGVAAPSGVGQQTPSPVLHA